MSRPQDLRARHHLVQGYADQVRFEFLEGAVEGVFIVVAFAHCVTDHAVAVADVKQHSSMVDAIKRGHVSH